MGRGETVVSREGLVTFVSSLDCSSNTGELLPDFNSVVGLGGITTGCTNGRGVGEEEGEWPWMYASCLLRLRGGLAGTFCLGTREGGRGTELVFFSYHRTITRYNGRGFRIQCHTLLPSRSYGTPY